MKKDELGISGMHDGATPNIFRNAVKLRVDMKEPVTTLGATQNQTFGFQV